MNDFVLVGIIGVGTLLMRASLVTLLSGVTLPEPVERALSLVAPAVLAGLVVQSLVLTGDGFRSDASWHLAAAVAAMVAWLTRSTVLTLASGMAAVWAFSVFF